MFTLIAGSVARAQGPTAIVGRIEIVGNQRVVKDAIRIHITQQVGQPLDQEAVDEDIKSIYGFGFFDAVTARLEQRGSSYILVYRVNERPQVTDVKFYGMNAIQPSDDKIVAATKVRLGEILNPTDVRDTIDAVTAVYADMGYTDAKVTFKPIPQPNNTMFGVFEVVEGPQMGKLIDERR